MYLTEGREPCSVVSSEEEVDVLVGVYAEELTDDLYGEYLRVAELWGGTALTEPPIPSFESVVHQAEDSNDEGAKIHERKTSFCSRWIGVPPRVGRSSV